MKLVKESKKGPVTFGQRLEAIQYVFKNACDKAVQLSEEMDREIDSKKAKIQEIEGEIKEIDNVKKQTCGFIDALNNLTGSFDNHDTD